MDISAKGRMLLEHREGCRLKAYQDSVGVWTIGYGHTSNGTPPVVHPGLTITQGQADSIFAADLAKFVKAVNDELQVTVPQNAFDALVSVEYNIGMRALAKSTIIKKLNAGDAVGAGNAFLAWEHPPELKGRREGERAQFLASPVAQ